MTDFLARHGLVKQAAAICKTFRLDPVTVLNGSMFEWHVRTAAHNVIAEQDRVEAEKMKSKSHK